MNYVAWFVHALHGFAAEAALLAREAARGFETSVGAEHSETLNVLDTLASALGAYGCVDEAAELRARIAAAESTADERCCGDDED